MTEISKLVVPRTRDGGPPPDTSVACGELVDEMASRREQQGGEFVALEGAGFARALSRAGPVNKDAIVTRPIACGGGLARRSEGSVLVPRRGQVRSR